MSETDRNLHDLRIKIDEIDAILHEAIMQRVAVIDEVAAAKRRTGARGSMMRPAREAEVMRSLIARHKGRMPTAALLRVWREIINSATLLQGPMMIAVCAPEKSVAFWDMARNHFGADTPMRLYRSAAEVLHRVQEDVGTIGILPLPTEGEAEPWWPRLVAESGNEGGARIVWRLPFFSSLTGRFEQAEAIAVASLTPEASGDDVTVAVIEVANDVSRARIFDTLAEVGIRGTLRAGKDDAAAGTRQHLYEFDGFVEPQDERLAALADRLGASIERIVILGAYPKPLDQH